MVPVAKGLKSCADLLKFVLVGEQCEFQAVRNPELNKDIGQVVCDGLLADLKAFGDGLVGVAFEYRRDHFELFRSQAKLRFVLWRFAETLDAPNQIRERVLTKPVLAFEDCVQTVKERTGR